MRTHVLCLSQKEKKTERKEHQVLNQPINLP